jgi:uncharacterized protein
MKIGIISDTHGKVPTKIYDVFEDVDQIWHAGDIGSIDVINELESIGPVTAVRGNMDRFPIINKYREHEIFEISKNRFYLTHQHITQNLRRITTKAWDFDHNFQMIICGHTHIPMSKQFNSVLYFNPGSAVHSRNSGKPSIGILTINKNASLTPEIIFI